VKISEILYEHRAIAANVQLGDYKIKIDQHLVDRSLERGVPEQEVLSSIQKLPKAKAKLKLMVPGEKFYLHDNTNDLNILFRVIDSERKIYIARTVYNKKVHTQTVPIIQVA